MAEEQSKISNKSLFVVGGVLLAIILGCAAWFSCREYCVTFFYNNYNLIISKLSIPKKFICFKIQLHSSSLSGIVNTKRSELK